MTHSAAVSFWQAYQVLAADAQRLADRSFEALKNDAHHPSLRLKKVGPYWSARVGLNYRALAVEIPEGLLWIWIGDHARYERLIS